MSQSTLISADQAVALDPTHLVEVSEASIISRTVLQTPDLRLVVFAFAAGQELSTHSSSRRALVQILSGECDFLFDGTWQRLTTGSLLHLPPGHPHALKAANGPFKMLLTLGQEPVRVLPPLP